MTLCVGDTGPLLHLHEINRLPLARLFSSIAIPDAVEAELQRYGIGAAPLAGAGLAIHVATPSSQAADRIRADCAELRLQEADQAVLALALDLACPTVLTDDLDLRDAYRRFGITPVGTIGVLFRSWATRQLDRAELERTIRSLFAESSIHLSPAFRAYILARLETMTD